MSTSPQHGSRSADKIVPRGTVRKISIGRGAPPPFRVEVATLTLAESLKRRLQPLEAEIAPVDGHHEVAIELRGRNPERYVVAALRSIDAWLLETGLAWVRVHLDGTSHTLHAWPPEKPPWTAAGPGAS